MTDKNDERRRWNKKTAPQRLNPRGGLTQKVKSARGRKLSSTLWIQRHVNDVYVREAKRLGLRSRAAFKFIELHERFSLFPKGGLVVDLGAAPGGWSEAALVGGARRVVGLDLLPIEPLAGAEFLELDFMSEQAPRLLGEVLGGDADAVVSDMAAAVIGHRKTDQARTAHLAEAAALFALDVLKPGGSFVTKVFQGGAEAPLLKLLKQNFTKTSHVKPKASRAESSELYLLARGYGKK